jgi:hypothetical protein
MDKLEATKARIKEMPEGATKTRLLAAMEKKTVNKIVNK